LDDLTQVFLRRLEDAGLSIEEGIYQAHELAEELVMAAEYRGNGDKPLTIMKDHFDCCPLCDQEILGP
jgi:hypothetical protein